MSKSRPCAQCGTTFVVPSSKLTQRYCSRICFCLSRRKVLTLTCQQCHKQFEKQASDRKIFCSRACSGKNLTRRKDCVCQYCQKVFQIRPAISAQFCGKACSDKAKIGTAAWNKKIYVVILCAICEKPFEVARGRQDEARYCSRACMGKGKRLVRGLEHHLFIPAAHITQRCAACGQLFRVKRAKVLMGEGRFCSRQCVGAYCTGKQQGRPSSLEVRVADALRQRGESFFAQMPLGPWTVDFFLPRLGLVLECDGDYWHARPEVQKRDRQKDGWMRRNNYPLVRIRESAIRHDVARALEEGLARYV